MVSPASFDHEKLDVYQLELVFLIGLRNFWLTYVDPVSTDARAQATVN
jgi:hypothetical protein